MKFTGKMWLMILVKEKKKQGFTLSLEDTVFGKMTGGVKLNPPPIF